MNWRGLTPSRTKRLTPHDVQKQPLGSTVGLLHGCALPHCMTTRMTISFSSEDGDASTPLTPMMFSRERAILPVSVLVLFILYVIYGMTESGSKCIGQFRSQPAMCKWLHRLGRHTTARVRMTGVIIFFTVFIRFSFFYTFFRRYTSLIQQNNTHCTCLPIYFTKKTQRGKRDN